MRSSNFGDQVSCNKVGDCEYSILDLIVFYLCKFHDVDDEYDMYGGMLFVLLELYIIYAYVYYNIICQMIIFIPHHTA